MSGNPSADGAAIRAVMPAYEAALNTLKRCFENATSLVFVNSGHFVPEERPALLAEALISFLKGESSR